MTPSELDRYCERIAYQGPREPTVPVLHALTSAHARSIPFENLAVLLGRGVDISPAAVFEKLVVARRGGYCFEQNGLLMRVLAALGFTVAPLSARVLLDRPPGEISPLTHMFVRVTIAGSHWLTDVGVGAASLTAALRFALDVEQSTPHEARRIVRDGERYVHQIKYGEQWVDVYAFTGEQMPEIDRVLGNWYTSTHPQSVFKRTLMVARASEDGQRVGMVNGDLKLRGRDGQARITPIASRAHMLELLREHFGLAFAPDTSFGAEGAAWPTAPT